MNISITQLRAQAAGLHHHTIFWSELHQLARPDTYNSGERVQKPSPRILKAVFISVKHLVKRLATTSSIVIVGLQAGSIFPRMTTIAVHGQPTSTHDDNE
eukprot:scaffold410552_cov21-Prasinocladus_malaysianus.AAC.1